MENEKLTLSLWPSCREVSRLVGQDALRESSAWTRSKARLHFLICRHCRRFARELRLLAAAARSAARLDPRLRAALDERLIRRLAAS